MADAFPIPTHKRFKDLRGKVFARWSVVSYAGMHPKNGAMWNCRCECGTERAVLGKYLWTEKSHSCGCYNVDRVVERNTRHGHAVRDHKIPEYIAWENMRSRCNCTTDPRFKWYGARGISVCERWNDFENFLADVGKRPSPNHTIDRRDNDRNYEPGNVRWATHAVQQNNRRPRNTVVKDRRQKVI
ncbi:AP2 domain-containing protein [Agrobacterium salinitolerans]|uniref:AP2 domain-containing protein n=1 Tax=Agrobacterium salinitolerans TaxID=1183413 RepID=UPI0015726110|nr:AP2 domain-containing protein [Agrobacterium salinitolerans]NTA36835.1 AP2 domain-containing protein [Agrobacterium salinitolerans]